MVAVYIYMNYTVAVIPYNQEIITNYTQNIVWYIKPSAIPYYKEMNKNHILLANIQ